MKKLVLISIFLLVSFFVGLAVAKHFWRGEIMTKDKVCKTWTKTPFIADKFKAGDEATRAAMACAIIEDQKPFIGKDRSDIRKELGDFDGFYFSDMFPAYMISSGKTNAEDSWQLVFLLNTSEKVSEVIVHKNCCE